MKIVYRAANAVEAHLLEGVLRQEGIAAQVLGADLQGAIGELPATGFVRIMVDDDDAERAREAIRRWEAAPVEEPGAPSTAQTTKPGTKPGARPLWVVAWFVTLIVLVWGLWVA